ncbi:cytochrome P450 4V2 [Galendromus occidentalis]|uniref:Cytochrome P450 4V2 n=1 Tax=Galendromus occidentalis TaxID=34638 RepID=A0AAJ7SIW1_9ACAR|nr:cytochrome P450 4V2 [Galendromus occidentalis]
MVVLPLMQWPVRGKIYAFQHVKDLFPTIRYLLWHLSMIRSYWSGLSYEVVFSNLCLGECMRKIRRGFIVEHIVSHPIFVIFRADHVEKVLSNSKNIKKGPLYDMIVPWLGRGLLTSDGTKWKSRRRLLTSSFHFKVLRTFSVSINEQAALFVERISKKMQNEDIAPYIEAFTLDVVCETIMGVSMNCQTSDNGQQYLATVKFVGKQLVKRFTDFPCWCEFIFRRTESGKQFFKAVKTLHEFSTGIIKDRKEELLRDPEKLDVIAECEESMLNSKKPLLDILLVEHLKHGSISTDDIREEVDTFMFEGHDTTSTAILWALHFIGYYPEVQEELKKEIDRFGGEDGTEVSDEQLKKLTYLDMVLKESQRLCPSVPLFSRRITEEIHIEDKPVPVGSEIIIYTSVLHRNPDVFPKPEEFDPDRFSTKNSRDRNPYAYLPFSAGPRNCIGQKFALLEEKILLVWILRRYSLKSLDHRDEIPVPLEMVLRPDSPVRVIFSARKEKFSSAA